MAPPPRPRGGSSHRDAFLPPRTCARIQGLPPPKIPDPPKDTVKTREAGQTSETTPENLSGSSSNESPEHSSECTPYLNLHDDPDPLPDTSSATEKEKHRDVLRNYGTEMLEAYKDTEMRGEVLWIDYLTAFRPHTIKSWTRPMLSRWTNLLTNRDIYETSGRQISKAQALVDLLYRENRIGVIAERGSAHIHEDDQGHQTNMLERSRSLVREEKNYKTEVINKNQQSTTAYGDDDPSDRESGIAWDSYQTTDKGPALKPTPKFKGQDGQEKEKEDKDNSNRVLGGSRLMKAYIGNPTFSGGWDEDIDNCISIYDILSEMCCVTDDEKLQSIPIMLSGDALSYFSSKIEGCSSYQEATMLLRRWYNSDEKRARILKAWQSMQLSDKMSKAPHESEVSVFRNFVARLMSLQKQLHPNYHSDEFIRDRLLTTVDIPSIQVTLRDRVPRSIHRAVNRIANQLSDKPKTVGSTATFLTEPEEQDDDETFYSLGKTYGGDAQRPVTKSWEKVNYHRRKGQTQGGRKNEKRLSPYWMRGIKGCFVCGKDHRANTRHPREEVIEAINRLKRKHPRALTTVADISAVMEMTEISNQDGECESDVQWDIDEEDEDLLYIAEVEEEQFSGINLMTKEDVHEIEENLANIAFIHGRSHITDMSMALTTMNTELRKGEGPLFDGVRLETCATRRSVMSKSQYQAYTKEFGLKDVMKPSTNRSIRGIGGTQKACGTARIQLPFEQLGIIIDVDSLIIEENIPYPLSMKDMLLNGLDISIQEQEISIQVRKQKLTMENYLLIYRYTSDNMSYSMYTESELRRIHRLFGHPYVQATEKLLRRAAKKDIDGNIMSTIRKIQDDCKVCKEFAATSRRFKLTVGTEDIRFNHRVYVDTTFINNRPVIHLVD